MLEEHLFIVYTNLHHLGWDLTVMWQSRLQGLATIQCSFSVFEDPSLVTPWNRALDKPVWWRQSSHIVKGEMAKFTQGRCIYGCAKYILTQPMDPEKKVWTLFSLLNMESAKVQKVSHWLSKYSFHCCSIHFHGVKWILLHSTWPWASERWPSSHPFGMLRPQQENASWGNSSSTLGTKTKIETPWRWKDYVVLNGVFHKDYCFSKGLLSKNPGTCHFYGFWLPGWGLFRREQERNQTELVIAGFLNQQEYGTRWTRSKIYDP